MKKYLGMSSAAVVIGDLRVNIVENDVEPDQTRTAASGRSLQQLNAYAAVWSRFATFIINSNMTLMFSPLSI